MNSSSEVLARKYRPKSFKELIGQDSITRTLSLALDSDRISHAYLLSGLRGSGKTSTARIFSKALVCENSPTSNPCDVCEGCRMANEGRHMDIIEMDAASSRKIDDIRSLIEHTKYRPVASKYKIFIIDEVHMLTKEAFNALLKTLEEPPEYVKFILATTDPLKLPATILSRTQHFRFKRISLQNIVHHLEHILQLENVEYEDEALTILARSGSGSLRDTLTLLDQAIIYSKNYIDVKTVTDMLGLIDPKLISDIFNAILTKDKEQIIAFIKMLEDYEAEMVVDEIIAYLKEQLYSSQTTLNTLLIDRFFRILSESKSLFAMNADGSFVLSIIFFKMLEALKVKEIDEMIESLENEIERPLPSSINISSNTSSQTHKEVPKQKVEFKSEKITKVEDKLENNFSKLVAKIYDRNIELGECFEQNVSFVSFENEVLKWESCAHSECKEMLKNTFSIIRQFVREIYGINTKIKSQACSKAMPQEEEKVEPTLNVPSEQITPSDKTMQSGSTIEDIETEGSCVTGCSTPDPTPEIDGATIMDNPMVKKATELFEATKIVIQSKV